MLMESRSMDVESRIRTDEVIILVNQLLDENMKK